MDCTLCKEPIPAERLKALPSADKCILCATLHDVPKTRRFDECIGDTTIENYYTGPDTPEIRQQQERLNHSVFGIWPEQEDFTLRSTGPKCKTRVEKEDEVVAIAEQGDTEHYDDVIPLTFFSTGEENDAPFR